MDAHNNFVLARKKKGACVKIVSTKKSYLVCKFVFYLQ
jgi:hypothetical protein